MKKLAKTLALIAAGAAAGAGLHHFTKKKRAHSDKHSSQDLKHSGTVTIETGRLILRRFDMCDAEAMYANWACDPQVTKFLQWKPHPDVDVTEGILESWLPQYEDKDAQGFYNWAIELKELGEPIGNISVVNRDDRARRAHVGYCLGKDWWRQGIMSEALAAVIDFLFSEGYLRIESRHNVNNPHSGDVMKKCGMQYEGTLRQSDWNNQGVCDASYYGLLASER